MCFFSRWLTLFGAPLFKRGRRFGKTISVSMFAAALLYSAKGVELSIYSTCKRISQKLLRNVQKFLNLIYEGLKVPPFKEIRCNMEELVLQVVVEVLVRRKDWARRSRE